LPVTEHDIIPVIMGTNVIGSPCCLSVERNHQEFDVQLTRSSALRLQDVDDILALVDDLQDTVKRDMRGSPASSGVVNKIDFIKQAIIAMEQRNCAADGDMFHKLTQLAAKTSEGKGSLELSPRARREDEKKSHTLAMKMEELLGGLETARSQRDSLEDENRRLRKKLSAMGASVQGGIGGGVTQERQGEISHPESACPMTEWEGDGREGKTGMQMHRWHRTHACIPPMHLPILSRLLICAPCRCGRSKRGRMVRQRVWS